MMSHLTHPVGRKAWVDVAKGLAIILVVGYHASLYLANAGVLGLPWIFKAPLELFPMPAFILIAGMLSARTVGFGLGDLWRRRILPMLYLYVLWSAIRFVFYLVLPVANADIGDLAADDPLSLALILVWPSSSYWFLYALALFTLAAWLLRKVPTVVQISLAAVVSALTTSGIIETHNVGWNRVLGLFVFYILGVTLSRRIFEGVQKLPAWAFPAALVVFAGVVAAMVFAGLRDIPGIALAGQALALVVGFSLAKLLAPVRATAFLGRWGESSLYIYLFHLFFIVPIAGVLGMLEVAVPRGVGFGIQFVLTLAAILLSLLALRLVGRFKWLFLPPRAWTRRPTVAGSPEGGPSASGSSISAGRGEEAAQ